MVFALGLVLFFGIHLLPYTPWRDPLAARLGRNAYRGVFSVLAIAGVALIWIGYPRLAVAYLFAPVPWARPALLALMPVVLVLLAAANMPTHIRRRLRHPMMIGTLVWAVLHFLANGERAASYLFGAFAIYAVVSLVGSSLRVRPVPASARPVAWRYDAMAAAGGIIAYAVLVHLHGWLFGVPLV